LLDDPRVRKALAMAVDRSEILALRYGRGELAVGPVPPYHPAYPQEIPPLPFAPDSATALLAEAGIVDRNGDGRLETPEGGPFAIRLLVAANNAFNRDMAEVIRSHLADVGVTVDVRYTEFGTMVGIVTNPAREFDAFLLSWEGDFRLNLRNIFHSEERDGPYAFAGYANPAVDSLIDTLAVTSDATRARPLYARLQRIMREEQPWMFLHYYPDLFAANERVQDMRMDIRGAFVTVADWWISGSAGPAQSDSAAQSPSPAAAPGQ
jgi:peptide/nickel transport system substrate-binding protein